MSIETLIAALAGRLFAVQADGSWMPVAASTGAPAVDRLFYFILWLSVAFFVLIVGLMVLFVVRYRRSAARTAPDASPSHNTALELTWTIIPLLLVMVIFAWGFKVFMDMSTPPGNAYEVLVTGQKWKWLFTYPNGHVDENLHVPIDTPVRLVMTSEDVIHSFYVPAFRMKKDVVPGRYSKAWFRANKVGEYQVYCAEYCGTSHSDMLSMVVVHEPGGFESWLERAADFLNTMPPAEAGAKLVAQRGCAQCHSVDGRGGIGPSLKGVFGHEVQLVSGQRRTADEDYIRTSILEPQAEVVAGYQPVMPTYKGRLKDAEITAIIEYLKVLSQ